MTGFRAGDLLVAAVTITDGVFDGAVVLLLDADDTGTVGVVLNRTTSIELSEALPAWAELVCEPPALFDGGPVSQQGAVCLAEPWALGEEPPGWRPVFDGVGLLNLDTPVEIAEGTYQHLRIFAGYAGWGSGQLQGELQRGLWHVVETRPQDVFDPEPATLWRRVLRRQGGELGWLSAWTPTPEFN